MPPTLLPLSALRAVRCEVAGGSGPLGLQDDGIGNHWYRTAVVYCTRKREVFGSTISPPTASNHDKVAKLFSLSLSRTEQEKQLT